MKKIIILIIALFLAYESASADINGYSGTISHGESVTVIGTSLGTHADNNEGAFSWQSEAPICAKFKDFEDGNLTSGGWGFAAVNNLYADWELVAGGRTNSTYYAYRECNNGDVRYDGLVYTMSKYNVSGMLYVRAYVNVSEVTASGGGKIYRIYGDSGNIYIGIDDEDRDLEAFSTMGGSAQWTSPDQYSIGSWDLLEWYVSDGNVVTAWLNGVQQWTQSDWMPSPLGGDGHSFDFGHMIEPGGDYYLFDDIYVDYTFSRFELCNSSTYSSATIREVQIPVSWSDTSVNISVNQGAFTDGASAWLYYIDATNTAGTGMPVTIGSSSSTVTCYLDADGDLYSDGTSETGVESCSENYYEAGDLTAILGDCNDSNAAINPGATEICGNDVDEDCDGTAQACPESISVSISGATISGATIH